MQQSHEQCGQIVPQFNWNKFRTTSFKVQCYVALPNIHKNHSKIWIKLHIPCFTHRWKCTCKCVCLLVLTPVTDMSNPPGSRLSGLFALRMLGKSPALSNPEPYKQFRKWTARWIHVIYLLTVPFSVMSLAAISVQRMLFQFRVNQGENENLTGLYYLYTENLLFSCCYQQSFLIMQINMHTRSHTPEQMYS